MAIDGDGLATPVVWGDRIYVLSAHSLEAGEGRGPATDASWVPLPKQRLLVCQVLDQAKLHLQGLDPRWPVTGPH